MASEISVKDHLLCIDGKQVRFHRSPNRGSKLVAPEFIIIHYTAGRGFAQSLGWLCSAESKASAHHLIGRKGEVVQMVQYDHQAWHAGSDSTWTVGSHTFQGLNHYSIGIELENFGPLRRKPNGWATWWGQFVPDSEIEIAEHKHGGGQRAWQTYTEPQILAVYGVCRAIMNAYPSIKYILGHEDVAPKRKEDPGPAFPLAQLRTWLVGRA